jgi:hypothetical protein
MRLLEELFNRVKSGRSSRRIEKHQKQIEEAKRKKVIEDSKTRKRQTTKTTSRGALTIKNSILSQILK